MNENLVNGEHDIGLLIKLGFQVLVNLLTESIEDEETSP